MSSIMRRRSGLMGFSLIGSSCLEVGVLEPLDSQDGTPGLSPAPAYLVTPSAPPAPRAARSRESGFVLTNRLLEVGQGMSALPGYFRHRLVQLLPKHRLLRSLDI